MRKRLAGGRKKRGGFKIGKLRGGESGRKIRD